ncbi:DMT family transporter [Clostridiaceae bacterium 35-E11]
MIDKSIRRIYFLMSISTLFWAGAFIAGKIGVKEIPPFSLAFFRFLFATMIIFVIMVKCEKKDWRLKKQDWLPIILLGVIGMFGYHVLFFTALKYTTAVNSAMIGATNPLITSILAAIFLKEKLGWKRFGAISLAFTGVALTISNGEITVYRNLTFNHGDLLMLVAVCCWAVYAIISKRVMERYSPLILTSYSFLVCLFLLIPFVILENPLVYLPHVTWKGWTSVLYMAIFPSVIGYLVQQMAIKQIGASRMAAFINLVPVFSIVLAWLILHETITLFKLFSAAIIISGVYLNTRLKSLEPEKLVKNKR